MTGLSSKKILIIGTGAEAEFAARLSQDFGSTYFHTTFNDIDPKYVNFSYGEGLGKVEKVAKPKQTARKVDMIASFDVGFGDEITDYRRQGIPCFGSDAKADVMEESRDKFREIQKALKLPTPDYEVVIGMEALKKYLKDHPGYIVKHNVFRGDRESYRTFDYDTHETLLDEWATNLGPKKEEYKFIVEAPISAELETGFDAFHGAGGFLFPYLRGYECSHAYIGKWEMEPPEPIATSMRKLAPLLKKMDYRGLISDEERILSRKKSIIIDMTMRSPLPLGLVYTEAVKNFSEVVWKIANGEKAELDVRGKYVACLPMYSQAAMTNWVRLVIDERDKQWVKLHCGCRYGDQYWAPRGQDIVLDLIAIGNSVPEVIGKIKTLTERMKYIDKEVNMTPFQEILKAIKDGNKMGLMF